MKIDLQSIPEDFVTRPVEVAGEMCYLVFPPHIGTKWTKDTLIFRSSVWNSEGELISAGFKKFFNWGEQPDLCYTPFSMTANGGVKLVEKIDGSTLIVSKYKGELICRTRGTVDASAMENGYELEFLKDKYPLAFDNTLLTAGYSLLYEWVSPENRIVLRYPEPDIYLIGAICHENYELMTQTRLDSYAMDYGVKRPRYFKFDSLKEMHEAVEAFKGMEGLCVYCNWDQDIRKVKGAEYLKLHHLKSELSSFEKVLDVYIEQNCPSYEEFFKYIEEKFDYEIANQLIGEISKCCDLHKKVNDAVVGMHTFVKKIKGMDLTRKQAAMEILQAYGQTNKSSFVFKIYDDRELEKKDIKKLFYHQVKKG